MEYKYSNNVIRFPNVELTILDKLTIDFTARIKCRYVIVSGYIALLFGRSRNTEDVDIFIEDKGFQEFSKFYEGILSTPKYYALNADDAADAYELMHEGSLRFAEVDTFVPNFEIKFAKDEADFYALNNALTVELDGGKRLKISPLELEIAYKLYLGSEKDFADASHLYIVFKHALDNEKLKEFLRELDIKKNVIKKILGDL
jgi:hypothetical protein